MQMLKHKAKARPKAKDKAEAKSRPRAVSPELALFLTEEERGNIEFVEE